MNMRAMATGELHRDRLQCLTTSPGSTIMSSLSVDTIVQKST